MPNTKTSKSKSKVSKRSTKKGKVSKSKVSKRRTRKIVIARKAPFKRMGKHPKKMVIPLFINPKFIRNGKVDWVEYTK
jgi:hypothetical protein